jgi:hypothetical protein
MSFFLPGCCLLKFAHPRLADQFASVGEKETAKLLLGLLESPEKFREYIRL